MFKLISNWANKKLKCSRCGTDRSVKYEYRERFYCNACILKEVKK